MKGTRRIAAVAVVVLLSGMSAGLLPARADTTVGMLEFNMAGWRVNHGGLAPANLVVQAVAKANSDAIALSEVCASGSPAAPGQWEKISSDLATDYDMFFAPSRTTPLGAGCASLGNVVGIRDTNATSSSHTFVSRDGFDKHRTIVCAETLDLVACSTHLVANCRGAHQAASRGRRLQPPAHRSFAVRVVRRIPRRRSIERRDTRHRDQERLHLRRQAQLRRSDFLRDHPCCGVGSSPLRGVVPHAVIPAGATYDLQRYHPDQSLRPPRTTPIGRSSIVSIDGHTCRSVSALRQ
jgi:hypothetical protein